MSTGPFHPGEKQPSGKPAEGEVPSSPKEQPSNPYEFNVYSADPYSAPRPDAYAQPQQYQAQYQPKKGLFGTDLSFEKTVVPNPLTHGLPPANQKSVGAGYALWFFFGAVGAHQFYLGNNARGFVFLIIWALYWVMCFIPVLGLMAGGAGLIWLAYWIYDAVTLSEQVNEINSGFVRKSIL